MEKKAPERETEFSPGDVCDGYRILRLIAAGGMGDVYEASHEASGRVVALKCLKVKHLSKDDARARMKMEAIVLSELQHANLVQVYDAGVTDLGMVWIAMERLHGQTLRQMLQRCGRVPIAETLYYASEIADGVDAVHEVHVIHRDLKPENVFVTYRNDVKVLDLGTGKFAGYGLNTTDRMKVVGTTAYMSPEQIKGLKVDGRADIYALGLMVYEMIAGRHPLAQEGLLGLPRAAEQVALLQLEATPAKLSDVSLGCPVYVARVVERAIAKDRDQRPPTMTAFCRELRGARKRFIAEQGLDDPLASRLVAGERLRHKLGAPPFPKPGAGSPPPVASSAETREPIGARNHAAGSSKPGDTVVDAFAPEPPSTKYLPRAEVRSPRAGRALGLDDAGNRTTNTNPIGLLRPVELTPEPHALPDLRRRPQLWARPGFRRMAVTLGLGALIGIPPAIVAVFWRAHRFPHVAASSNPLQGSEDTSSAAPAGDHISATAIDFRPTALRDSPDGAQTESSSEGAAQSDAMAARVTEVTAVAPGAARPRGPRTLRTPAPRSGPPPTAGIDDAQASNEAPAVLETPNFGPASPDRAPTSSRGKDGNSVLPVAGNPPPTTSVTLPPSGL